MISQLLADQADPQPGIETKRKLPARSLRHLLVRLATVYDVFPTDFLLKDVVDDDEYAGIYGTLGHICRGSWKGTAIALRYLRDEIATSAEKRRVSQAHFLAVSFLWFSRTITSML